MAIGEHIKEHAILGVVRNSDASYYTQAEVIALLTAYLKLDQTTPQDVDNGAPTFNGGVILKSGQRLVFDG